jgi:hypothetical protein
MIATIALDDGLILPHSANPTGSNFRERQVYSLCLLYHGMPELLVERHPVSWAGHCATDAAAVAVIAPVWRRSHGVMGNLRR